ncbi:hypothetical protein [Telluribacter sp.]|jgi:hypothetical protein|uniref:hypothetical protein n=1 Tax=Telluribacter sp. TaxID=1978767 RepID=UPI002E12BF36|nr:hypothetical protein [Telluribacter sp.]
MKVNKLVWLVMLIVGFTGCERDPDVLPGSVTYDIMGPSYPNGIFSQYLGNPTFYANSIRLGSCSHEVVSSSIDRPITKEAQLRLSLNIPSIIRQYTLYSTNLSWEFCSLDSIVTTVSVMERPTPGYIDLVGLAAYRVIDDKGSYLEVTRYDEKKRWIEGRFQLKAVRTGVMGYPLPLADTLVITNGKFGFGFKRE